MREVARDPDRLRHMLKAMDFIIENTNSISYEYFAENAVLFYAIVKNIEIIGEAAYMLSENFKKSNTETDWQDIVAMRHFLVHGYYQVKPSKVWNVIERDILPLKNQIEQYLTYYNDTTTP